MSQELIKLPLYDHNKKLMVKSWLDEYLEEVLSHPQLRYMLLHVNENSGYIYVKITDRLRPPMYLAKNGYEFNKHIIFRQPSSSLYNFSNKTQKEFNEYMKISFDPNGYIESFLKNLK